MDFCRCSFTSVISMQVHESGESNLFCARLFLCNYFIDANPLEILVQCKLKERNARNTNRHILSEDDVTVVSYLDVMRKSEAVDDEPVAKKVDKGAQDERDEEIDMKCVARTP
jgi:hypothetical protein